MEQNFIRHGEDIITITGNARCTNGDCPYIKYVGDCPGNIENYEYKKQRNDAFIIIRLMAFNGDRKVVVY